MISLKGIALEMKEFFNGLLRVWVFFVIGPFQEIATDVFPDAGKFPFISDNPFVIIALPYGNACTAAHYVDLFSGIHLEIADYFRDHHISTSHL